MTKTLIQSLAVILLAVVSASALEAQAPRGKVPARSRLQAAEPAITELFPLAVGNRWVYAARGRFEQQARVVTINSRQRIGNFVYYELEGWSYAPALVRMTPTGRLMAYNREAAREELWYDFAAPEGGGWTPEFRNECTGTATVLSGKTNVAVPAGDFADAFLVGYRGTECADAGFSEEAFVPGLGPIKQGQISLVGETVWVLVEAHVGPHNSPAGGLSISLSIDQPLYTANLLPPVEPGEAIPTMEAAITLRNSTQAVIPLVFMNGQSYEFLVRDLNGRVLYRWSEGMFFTEAIRNEEFGPGLRAYSAEIPLGADGEPFPEGDYTLEAWLTAKPTLSGTSVEERFPYAAAVSFSIRHVF